MYLADIFTVGANLARIPAISIPSGTVERDGIEGAKSHMPVGLHLMAPEFGEAVLFDIGKKFYK